jgi:hypothetical protein
MPVPVFTSGEVLTAANMNLVGLWKVATGSLSLTTTPTNVTGVFDNTKFKNYRVVLDITARSTSNRFDIKYIIGTTATSVNYYQGGIGSDWSTNATLYYQRSNNDSQFFFDTGTVRGSYSLDIFAPNSANPTSHFGQTTASNTGFSYAFGGVQTGNNAFTGFQIICSTGTMTVNYQVFGYRD